MDRDRLPKILLEYKQVDIKAVEDPYTVGSINGAGTGFNM